MPETISASDLDKESRSRLMSLSRINAENVARHLVYAGTMMDENPEVAYEHAQAAYRHAARIDIVREALGLAAYLTGRYNEALRELRTYRRMTDDYTHVAIEADSERGLGRPEKALAFIAEIPMKKLDRDSQIELALVTSGARADAGDSEGGLAVLEKINPESLDEMLRARFELIRADRLEELERSEEAEEVRKEWEPIFTAEGEVDLYEDDEDDLDSEEADPVDDELGSSGSVDTDSEESESHEQVEELDEASGLYADGNEYSETRDEVDDLVDEDPENTSSDEILDDGDGDDPVEDADSDEDDFYDVTSEVDELEVELDEAEEDEESATSSEADNER